MSIFSRLFRSGPDVKPVSQVDADRAKTFEPEPVPEPVLTWPELSPADCEKKIAEGGVTVLDVRTSAEYTTRRIDGSKLIPVQVLMGRLGELDKNATYIVHCEHGMRSADACAMMTHSGFKNIYEMAGGLASYSGPTVRGPVK